MNLARTNSIDSSTANTNKLSDHANIKNNTILNTKMNTLQSLHLSKSVPHGANTPNNQSKISKNQIIINNNNNLTNSPIKQNKLQLEQPPGTSDDIYIKGRRYIKILTEGIRINLDGTMVINTKSFIPSCSINHTGNPSNRKMICLSIPSSLNWKINKSQANMRIVSENITSKSKSKSESKNKNKNNPNSPSTVYNQIHNKSFLNNYFYPFSVSPSDKTKQNKTISPLSKLRSSSIKPPSNKTHNENMKEKKAIVKTYQEVLNEELWEYSKQFAHLKKK